MAERDDIWTAVQAAYPLEDLIALTNPQHREETTVNEDTALSAVDHVLGLWPLHVQADYRSGNATDQAIAIRGVIAVLCERGGTAPGAANEDWKEVVGMMEKLKAITSRSAVTPDVVEDYDNHGRVRRGYSESIPRGFLPGRHSLTQTDLDHDQNYGGV